jgi:hypothetical protein
MSRFQDSKGVKHPRRTLLDVRLCMRAMYFAAYSHIDASRLAAIRAACTRSSSISFARSAIPFCNALCSSRV